MELQWVLARGALIVWRFLDHKRSITTRTMMIGVITVSQSTGPKTSGAVVVSVSVGVDVGVTVGSGVGDAVGTGVGTVLVIGVGEGVGVGFGTAVGVGVGEAVGVGVGPGFTVTETALEAGEVTGTEALSVTLQITECPVPDAV